MFGSRFISLSLSNVVMLLNKARIFYYSYFCFYDDTLWVTSNMNILLIEHMEQNLCCFLSSQILF